ncbi:MAG: membrane protein insertion efficiency factor YidD [Saprospiraceae bacterium]|mgnify:FL=1
MKWILIKIIELYWKYFSNRHRRTCLFKESCSKFVHRITLEQGFIKGISALHYRVKKCRGGFIIKFNSDGVVLMFKDGGYINEEYISPDILMHWKFKSVTIH